MAEHSPVQQVWGWFAASVLPLSFVVVVALRGLAPSGRSGAELGGLLFVAASVHVASTATLWRLPAVRRHAGRHVVRFRWVPLGLVVGAGIAAASVPERRFAPVVVLFLLWQFFHYQKQNLGFCALVATSAGVPGLAAAERRCVRVSGWCGLMVLAARPRLLTSSARFHAGILFPCAAVVLAAVFCVGARIVALREPAQRPASFTCCYLVALAFPLPLFVFHDPLLALGPLTVAHGIQYLGLVGLVGAGPVGAERRRNLVVVTVTALGGGVLLNLASHLHGGGQTARAAYGAVLGMTAAHVVVDGGLWRLRDAFPRALLGDRVPWLFPSPTDRSSDDVVSAA